MKKKYQFFYAFIFSLIIFLPLKSTYGQKYEHELAIAMIFQNEAEYLHEWIEYHRLVGVTHFYLYEHLSTDDYYSVLQPYIASGVVELVNVTTYVSNQSEWSVVQVGAYWDAIEKAKGKAKWLALIDADEMIVPLSNKPLTTTLKKFEPYGGVYMNYLCFGTSNVQKIPADKLMIETLLYCDESPMAFGKSIARPERVRACMDPHRMHYKPPYDHVNTAGVTFDWAPAAVSWKEIGLFHYCTRDLDHVINTKIPRRQKWIGIEQNSYLQSIEHFNARYNPYMLRFVPELRKRMGKH